MNFHKRILRRLARSLWGSQRESIVGFRYSGPELKPNQDMNDLERLFWSQDGAIVHKWIHYFDIYDRHFSSFRGTSVRFLEIGVYKGGSLDMWRNYFGRDAVIFGIDINPTCAEFDGVSGQVRIGSQDDPVFLKRVVEEMGGVDLVLDDGSHDSVHIRKSLDVLFPHLSDNGCYMIEDLHAAYWASHSGGYRRPGSFITAVKSMIDDLHHWYHDRGLRIPSTGKDLRSVHAYDSIVVLEKGSSEPPSHHRRG